MKEINIFDDEGPIDIKVIDEFEKSIGKKFPIEYKVLLSKHDALCPEENIFSYFYNDKALKGDVSFFGYGNRESPESIANVQQQEYGYNNIVVIGGTANGDYISFDFRLVSTNPKVVLMLHDVFDENEKMIVIPLADSFVEFIDLLEVEES